MCCHLFWPSLGNETLHTVFDGERAIWHLEFGLVLQRILENRHVLLKVLRAPAALEDALDQTEIKARLEWVK